MDVIFHEDESIEDDGTKVQVVRPFGRSAGGRRRCGKCPRGRYRGW